MAPRLRIRRPSPTTVEFTVTTLPPSTFALLALRHILLLVRLISALAVVLILLLRAQHAVGSLASPPSLVVRTWPWHALETLRASPVGGPLSHAGLSMPLPLLVAVAFSALYVLSLRVHAEESLLVLRGLGVQTSETAGTYLASTATRFIPTEKIQDIYINEAFRGFEVRYYLVVVVEGEEDLVVVFPGFLPKRHVVETVWRGARECLYERRVEEKT
ncbi:GPI-GlcNAc transferase complex, PIG-H component-domain-containing protein [Stachybotrys elegans]|uniref:GPI-GlcNAc transferase complex, PIG-H component-domain-containing protein n=1 Tax=Stachybotrys elegans TaxID=80388 RepID=A0A8K0WTD7_9HYPO|nr:GPI-GlcNAc transferase complex, PIG-H component-domain-containing protein [Stachybotrys elegans]